MKYKFLKPIALMLVTALLCGLIPTMTATAETKEPAELFSLMGTSRSEVHKKASDGSAVLALAFRYRIETKGLEYGKGRVTITDNATVTFGDNTYRLVKFGAIMVNIEATGNNPNGFKIGASGVTNIEANYLFGVGSNHGEFVARIVNVPERYQDKLIYARPYFVCLDENGTEVIHYGNIDCANASGKKVRYAVTLESLSWTSGSLDKTTGAEKANTKEIRTDYINSTDLLIRLPENSKGTPTAYVRAYYYSADDYLSSVDVSANWTVLKDLGIPQSAVAVRLVAYAADGSVIKEADAFGEDILITANKKNESLPLTFQDGGLSATTGVEVADETTSRTTYLPVQNLLVRPENGTVFKAYFYDEDKKLVDVSEKFMKKAKKVLDLAPSKAAYVRFLLQYTDPEGEGDSGLAIPASMAYFNAYLPGTDSYENFAFEAEEDETTTTTTTTTTKKPTTATTTKTTSPTTTKPSSSTGTTNKTSTTTKKTTTTTKKTTTTTKKPINPNEPLKLTNDKPANQGVQNALWRMEQLVKISYTPLRTIPQSYKDLPANVTKKGVPYSSSRIEQAYVPNNVSFHTFMTALQNPKSYLYTVDLGEDYGNKNGDTYYGTVCSTTCGYALGIVGDYTTYQWTQIPGMELLKEQDLQRLKLGDTIVGQGHVVMITGITRDQDGRIVEVEVSESGGVRANAKKATITALEERFPADKYEYCRYSYIKDVTYTASEYVAVGNEKAQTVTYNTNIIPRKGDKANWRTSETVILDVVKKSSYTKVEIYKYVSGAWKKQSTKTIADTIKLTKQDPGTYKARLTNGTKNSGWCYWRVVKAESKGEHYQGTRKVKVSFSCSSNAEPLFVQWMNGATNATVRITQLTEEQKEQGYGIFVPARGDLKVRVAFKTDYGIIYAELPEIITVK